MQLPTTPTKSGHPITVGDYAFGILISLAFSAVITVSTLYCFCRWQPKFRPVQRIGAMGLVTFVLIWIGLTIWPVINIKPRTGFLQIGIPVASFASLFYANSHPDWPHGLPYFALFAISVMTWLVKAWLNNPQFKSHKKEK
jgi:hypothetical protein